MIIHNRVNGIKSLRCLLLLPVMKRSPASHISFVFLVLFTCTFSFRNAVAATGNFSRTSIDLFKAIEKRGNDCTPEVTDLLENESEDETEDEAASFGLVSCQAGNSLLFTGLMTSDNMLLHFTPSFRAEIKHPLYLVMRSFRV